MKWIGFFIFFLGTTAMITGCTLSFQNINTHGTATDLVDENQDPTAQISANVTP